MIMHSFRRFASRLLRDQRGAVAIEFALISSVLILLMVMAADLGLAMRHRSQMEGAARSGLQQALDSGASLADVQDMVLSATDLPSSTAPTATAVNQCYCAGSPSEIDCGSGTCGAAEKQEFVQVTLSQEHRWLLGFPGLSDPLVLTVVRSLRVE